MSIVRCDKCEKTIDSDIEVIYVSNLNWLCYDCKEEHTKEKKWVE